MELNIKDHINNYAKIIKTEERKALNLHACLQKEDDIIIKKQNKFFRDLINRHENISEKYHNKIRIHRKELRWKLNENELIGPFTINDKIKDIVNIIYYEELAYRDFIWQESHDNPTHEYLIDTYNAINYEFDSQGKLFSIEMNHDFDYLSINYHPYYHHQNFKISTYFCDVLGERISIEKRIKNPIIRLVFLTKRFYFFSKWYGIFKAIRLMRNLKSKIKIM